VLLGLGEGQTVDQKKRTFWLMNSGGKQKSVLDILSPGGKGGPIPGGGGRSSSRLSEAVLFLGKRGMV